MTSLNRNKTTLALAIVVALALSAMMAASASASVVNGKFSASSFKLTGSNLTVKRGTETKTCTPPSVTVYAFGSEFLGSNTGSQGGYQFNCTDLSILIMKLSGQAKYDTVSGRYYLHVLDYSGQALQGPWGQYFQETANTDDWTWSNGSATTPSTITLSEQWIGSTASPFQHITVSGTLTATTTSGGLITLSH